jgi:hypothetical protein
MQLNNGLAYRRLYERALFMERCSRERAAIRHECAGLRQTTVSAGGVLVRRERRHSTQGGSGRFETVPTTEREQMMTHEQARTRINAEAERLLASHPEKLFALQTDTEPGGDAILIAVAIRGAETAEYRIERRDWDRDFFLAAFGIHLHALH